MDILYIIGKGCSKCDNFELRCSLRSLEKYGKNIGKIYVAGYCPDWLSDEVVKVPLTQPYSDTYNLRHKHINMIWTILETVKRTDIGEEFLVSMDDHFYVKEVDFDNYPYYCKMSKSGMYEIPSIGNTIYKMFLIRCKAYLMSKNLSLLYYTLHRNLHCSRKVLEECKDMINEVMKKNICCEPFLLFNNYLHTKYGIPATPVRDAKLSNAEQYKEKVIDLDSEVFSTVDFTKDSELYNLLNNLYNFKSKYEK